MKSGFVVGTCRHPLRDYTLLTVAPSLPEDRANPRTFTRNEDSVKVVKPDSVPDIRCGDPVRWNERWLWWSPPGQANLRMPVSDFQRRVESGA